MYLFTHSRDIFESARKCKCFIICWKSRLLEKLYLAKEKTYIKFAYRTDGQRHFTTFDIIETLLWESQDFFSAAYFEHPKPWPQSVSSIYSKLNRWIPLILILITAH